MEVMQAFFPPFNCLTLVPFLCLIVTSDLLLGAFCAASQHQPKETLPLIADFVDDQVPKTNYANILNHVGVRRGFSVRSESLTQGSSWNAPVFFTKSLTTSRRTKTLLKKAKPNNKNNDFLILPGTNKGSLNWPPGFDDGVKGDSSLALRDITHSTIPSRPRRASNGKTNAFINTYFEGTTKFGEGSESTNANKVHEPFSTDEIEMIESPTYRESEDERAIDPFPVAYLMNSQYELEPPLIPNPVEYGREGFVRSRKLKASRDDDRFVYRSDRHGDGNNPVFGHARDLEMTLLMENGDDDIDSSTGANNKSAEIASNFPTTIMPEEMATMMMEEEVTSTIPLSDEEAAPTQSNISVEDTDNPNNITEEVGYIPLRGKCNETSQCFGEHVECRLGICKCQLGYLPRVDNGELCGEASAHHVEVPTTDPTMIGVVVGLALMSVTLCIVLRLFAKARFRENRTIFNTPNPRLMNVSLLKGSKTLLRGNSAGQRSRRGSQVSMASGQGDGSPVNITPDGNGAGSSSHPHRVKPSRTLSTDTTNLEGTPTSTRPLTSNRSKFRQDSVASNV